MSPFSVYLLSGWSSQSYIESFIAIILLLSLDFWTVKNITGMASIIIFTARDSAYTLGRIMAGLRWWNYINDEGQSVWNFESSSVEDQIKFSKAEIQIFWFGLIIFPVIWVRLWSFVFSVQSLIVK